MLLRLVALAIVLQVVVGDSALDKWFNSKKDYIKNVDPGNLTLAVGISYVCGVYNRRSHILTSRVFEKYSWTDPRLAWNPKDYSGLTRISVPADVVWSPDTKLFNAFSNSEEVDYTEAMILSNGTVIWVPRVTYTTLCDDEHHGRHHTHHCHLQLGSWTRNAQDMPLTLFEGGFDTHLYFKECPYVVSHYTARIKSRKYDCCPVPFLFLEVDLDIERRHHHDDDEEEEEEQTEKKKRWEKYTSKKPCFWPHC